MLQIGHCHTSWLIILIIQLINLIINFHLAWSRLCSGRYWQEVTRKIHGQRVLHVVITVTVHQVHALLHHLAATLGHLDCFSDVWDSSDTVEALLPGLILDHLALHQHRVIQRFLTLGAERIMIVVGGGWRGSSARSLSGRLHSRCSVIITSLHCNKFNDKLYSYRSIDAIKLGTSNLIKLELFI